MKRVTVKIARNVAAGLLLILAAIGGLLPILQGWVFLVAAIAVMDFERKRIFNRWLLTQTFLRRLGGERLYRRLHHRPRNCDGTPRDAKNGARE